MAAVLSCMLLALPAAAQQDAPARQEGTTPSLPPPSLGPQREAKANQYAAANRLLEGLRTCRAERLAADRTRCYDDLASRAEGFFADVEGVSGNWRTRKPQDGTVLAGTPAVTVDSDSETFSHTKAALFVRCRAGRTDLYLALGTEISVRGDPVDVTLRYDGTDDVTEPWEPSVNGTALGLWGNARASEVLLRLLRSDSFSLRLTLPNDKKLFVGFDLRGIADAIVPVRQACGGF
jgi:type VI secretion system protein VasI